MAEALAAVALAAATMLYRPGTAQEFWGIPCDTITVDEPEVEALLADGWHRSPLAFGEVVEPGAARATELGETAVVEADTRLNDFMLAVDARAESPGADVTEAVIGYIEKIEGGLAAATTELDAIKASQPDTSLLDGTADEVIAAVPDLDIAALAALRVAESAGKTRKTVVAAIDAALADKLTA